MIRHILLFKFNEEIGPNLRDEVVDRLVQLGEVCPTISSWNVGVNYADSPSAYDVVEIGDFETAEDLEAYKAHPAHRDFSSFIKPLASWALADYEVEKVADSNSLEMAKDTPPFSLVFNGAKHNRSSQGRGNREYYELRNRLLDLTDGQLSVGKLGRVMVKLVKGHLPEDYFSYVPGKGLTYHGGIEEIDDIRFIETEIGKVTTGHVISIFHKLSH